MTDDLLQARVIKALRAEAEQRLPPVPPLDGALRRSRALVRRRRARFAGAAALALAVAAAVGLSIPDHKARPAPVNPSGVSIQALPPGPLSARANLSVAWTPGGLFVWGGDKGGAESATTRTFDDGAIYDPSTNSWRTIAASPMQGTNFAPAIWTGAAVLVAGGRALGTNHLRSAAALYSPASDRWTRVPNAPNCPSLLQDLGRSVIAIGSCAPKSTDAARWQPQTSSWEALPSTGLQHVSAAATWRGHVVVTDPAGQLRRLDGSTWTSLPSPPQGDPGYNISLVGTADDLFAVVYSQANDHDLGILYRLDDEAWTELVRGRGLVPDPLLRNAVATTNGVVWPSAAGLCRWAGSITCIQGQGKDGLTRRKTTYVAGNDGNIYVWGGAFPPPTDNYVQNDVTTNGGVIVSFR